MKIKLWQMAVLMAWLTLVQPGIAQLPPPRDGRDHPSHRYLPPPTGALTTGKANVTDQINALERLAAGDTEGQSPFQLSPAQLKQLDSIVESFRNDKGDLELPDPQSIPKQWIDSLLPDPKQRQQVKDVLEEYARTRNLQLDQDNKPNSLPPFDSSPAATNGSKSNGTGNGAGGSRSTVPSPNPGNNASRANSDVLRQNSGAEPPESSEAVNDGAAQNRLAELQKLYESLKKIQEQRAQQEQQRDANSSRWQRFTTPGDRNRNATGASRNDPRGPRPPRPNESSLSGPNASGSRMRDRTDRMPGTNQSRPNDSNNSNNAQSGRFRPAPQLTDDDLANGLRNQSTGGAVGASAPTANNGLGMNGVGADNSAPPGNAPLTPPADPKVPALTPFDEGYDFSKDQKVAIDPFAQPEDATADQDLRRNGGSQNSRAQNSARQSRPVQPFDVRRLAQEPRAQTQTSTSGSGESGFDLKKSIDQSGLGTTLKRLVQKTLKEQGFDPSQPGNRQPQSPNSNAPGGQLPTPDLAGGKGPGAVTTEQLKKWANAVATAPSTSTNTSTPPSNSEWGKWVREVWQAVAEAPARSPSNTSASSAGSSSAAASSPFGQLPDVRWTNSMTIAVLLVAGLFLVLVWLSRRRVAELADATAAQAEWVRTVMAQGLKTRADVIRAFHQLVKQSRAVSDWWTHRSIVKHFSSQTPQLATAISELAVVYEQARYYPEDVELSQQQLAQVRTLLESVKIPSSNRA